MQSSDTKLMDAIMQIVQQIKTKQGFIGNLYVALPHNVVQNLFSNELELLKLKIKQKHTIIPSQEASMYSPTPTGVTDKR